VVLLGGLSGRLDQTVHTMSLLHKLRKKRRRTFVVTDENVCWVLHAVRALPVSPLTPSAHRCPGRAHHSRRSRYCRTDMWTAARGSALDYLDDARPPLGSWFASPSASLVQS
jgi:hypothetical protein